MNENRVIEMPSEVLRIMGVENLAKLSQPAYNSALLSLEKMYKEHGLEWIKENAKPLQDAMSQLEMF
jgi:hypothetical protein